MQNIVQFPPSPLMKNFIWSPSKLAAYVGDLNWNNGCGVKLYLDQFAGLVYAVCNNAFTFGTFVHEILEMYHAGAEKPPYEMLPQWGKQYWIASIYKEEIKKKFGDLALEKLECDEPIGFGDIRRDTPVTVEYLENVYTKVNMQNELLMGAAKRWMFLGYGSEEEEQAYQRRAQMIFEQYYQKAYIKPTALESSMLIKLGDVSIRGRIDRIDAIDANFDMGYRIVDYKTSKKTKSIAELQKDFQMICYHIAAKEIYKVANESIEVGLFFLAPESKINGVSKPQPMVLNTTKITQETIDKATAVVVEADKKVKNGIFHYVDYKGTWQCPWCSYYGKCGK